jgi:hypothetical protein
MVQSNIIPNIHYTETKEVDKVDLGHSTSIYEIEWLNNTIGIVLGRVRMNKKEVIYCPIYGLTDDEKGFPVIHSQLGVIESPVELAIDILDNSVNTDVNFDSMKSILWYSFVNEEYLRNMNSHPEKYHILFRASSPEGPPPDWQQPKPEPEPQPQPQQDDDDIFENIEPSKPMEQIEEELDDGIFRVPRQFQHLPPLEEETAKTAQKLKAEYDLSPKDPWIQKFMKNGNYSLSHESNTADCFFQILVDAFASIGKFTDIHKLRAIVANAMTQAIYQSYSDIWRERMQNMKELKKLKEELKIKPNKEANREELEKYNVKAHDYNNRVNQFKNDKNADYDYMKNVHSLDEFRIFIMTANYWADAVAIEKLERELKFKTIVFNEESFQEEAPDDVMALQCGDVVSSSSNVVHPEHYIMTSKTDKHYRLIVYKERKILTFRGIPYDVKTLILKKCMENNSGDFNRIPEFDEWKQRFNISANVATAPATATPTPTLLKSLSPSVQLFDKDVVFVFYGSSPSKPAPGKGSGETLSAEKRNDYKELALIDNWRRKLDDSWEKPEGSLFQLDNHQWKSVSHYMLGVQYKNGFPDIYTAFSLDSNTDISKDLEAAKKAIHKKTGVITIAGKKGKPDPGFFNEMNLENIVKQGREIEERQLAVRAKFEQDLELKKTLLLTKNAHLMHFIRAQPPESDLVLMTIRKLLE